MVTALHACVVRVRATATNRVVGAGFLVSHDRIATCAHVVREALGLVNGAPAPDGVTLPLDLPLLEGASPAVGRFEWWEPGADLAILSLSKPVPGAGTTPVVRAAELANHPVTAIGFPTGFDKGMWSPGIVLGLVSGGRYHLQARDGHGFRVEGGFSGSPVWDEQLQAVVGMVTSSVEGEGAEFLRSAFLIPLDVWVKARPEWAEFAPVVLSPKDAIRATEEKYLRDLAGEYLYLKFRGIEQVEKWQSLPLDDVFVDLKAFPESATSDGSDAANAQSLVQMNARRRLETARPEDRERLAEELLAEELQNQTDSADKREPVPIAGTLAESRAIVVLGGPGSGKTTLVKRLARSFALGEVEARKRYPELPWCFPVTVAAALYAGGSAGKALLPFLREKLRNVGGPALVQAFDSYWATGRCMILIDGLDEIADTGDRIVCAREVDKLISDIGNNRVLVSSRPVGYLLCRLASTAEAKVAHIRLAPLAPLDVEAFAHKWHEAYELAAHREYPNLTQAKFDATALLREVRSNPQVADLTRNPLMLTIVALIKQQHITLPERRVQLYETVLNTLINSWNKARNLEGIPLGVPLSLEETKKVWGAVAHWMHTKNTGTVTRSQLLERLIDLISKTSNNEFGAAQAAEGYLKVASEGVGLLEARGANTFAFLHQTFQEYLAARHLTRSSARAVAELTAISHDPRWREVIRLAAGYIGVIREDEEQVTELLQTLARQETSPFDQFLLTGLRLAAACLSDDVRASATVADAILKQICDMYFVITCTPVKKSLIRALKGLKTNAPVTATKALTSLLVDDNQEVQCVAARFLGRSLIRDPSLVPLFSSRLGATSNSELMFWLASSLFEIGDETQDVIDALGTGGFHLRVHTTNKVLVGQQKRILKHFPAKKPIVTVGLARLLGERGEREVAAITLVSLLTDEDSRIRAAAAQLLGEWGEQKELAVRTIVALVGNGKLGALYDIIYVLNEWKHMPGVIPDLVVLLGAESARVRIDAADILIRWAERRADVVEHISPLLDYQDHSIQIQAAKLLVRLGQRGDVIGKTLVPLLNAEQSNVQMDAAAILREWDDYKDAVIRCCKSNINHENPDIWFRATVMLYELGVYPECIIERCRQLLINGDERSQWGAAGILAMTKKYQEEMVIYSVSRMDVLDQFIIFKQFGLFVVLLSHLTHLELSISQHLMPLFASVSDIVRDAVTRIFRKWGPSAIFHFVLPHLDPLNGETLAESLTEFQQKTLTLFPAALAQSVVERVRFDPTDTLQIRSLKDLVIAGVWDMTVGDDG